MRSNIIYALVLLGAVVGVQAAECKGNDKHCGECNGTSCNIGLQGNQPCCEDTSCVGTGGGDGAYCGTTSDYATDFCYRCPVKK